MIFSVKSRSFEEKSKIQAKIKDALINILQFEQKFKLIANNQKFLNKKATNSREN